MTTPENNGKIVKVGINQIINTVQRIDKEMIKGRIIELSNGGSPIAPMYNIEEVKTLFTLSDDEYNTLYALATKPRSPRAPKNKNTEEVMSLATSLATKKSKFDNINAEITKLTGERETLQREINEILSKLKKK
jgi:predicted transcriptional regulator